MWFAIGFVCGVVALLVAEILIGSWIDICPEREEF